MITESSPFAKDRFPSQGIAIVGLKRGSNMAKDNLYLSEGTPVAI
jgi:hypothetical protein